MKAIIRLEVPEYQIGQEVSCYFKDTMSIKGICEKVEPYEDTISIQVVLDKIRAEIIENSIEDYIYHGCGSEELIIDTNEVLKIIDKYKAESENEK